MKNTGARHCIFNPREQLIEPYPLNRPPPDHSTDTGCNAAWSHGCDTAPETVAGYPVLPASPKPTTPHAPHQRARRIDRLDQLAIAGIGKALGLRLDTQAGGTSGQPSHGVKT
jgi:hypothetical protein